MYLTQDGIVYSPSDLIVFLESPFASWMDHYYLLDKTRVTPDEDPAEKQLVAKQGDDHEQAVLAILQQQHANLVCIAKPDRTQPHAALQATEVAFASGASCVYQAYLRLEAFAGLADFIIRGADGKYQIWDTKLARTLKPYYAIQLCCYAEMLEALIGKDQVSDTFGIILGTGEWVTLRRADYRNYYNALKARFLEMHVNFVDDLDLRPEPLPRADHGKWTSHAESYFLQSDHLVQVAGISVGNIKKLRAAGITTMAELAVAAQGSVPSISNETFARLTHQARLQVASRDRLSASATPDAEKPVYEVLLPSASTGKLTGLSRLPVADPSDVFFDLEGYPLIIGGLEYLWGAAYYDDAGTLHFVDWWAHDRDQERLAFEGFIDWVYARWKSSPGMHIYHYAAYEVSVIRRLSTRFGSREEEVDDLLKNDVFVDLYQIVVQSLRIGEDSYSIKRVERLYRKRRATSVATAGESIVEYARWMESQQPTDWKQSDILRGIRDYNMDDCFSTAELVEWLRNEAARHNISLHTASPAPLTADTTAVPLTSFQQNAQRRKSIEMDLRGIAASDATAGVLADLVDFHRREQKPMWWALFDRLASSTEDLWLDASCIANVSLTGVPTPLKQSLLQQYTFDANQECKLAAGEKVKVMFTSDPNIKLTLHELDTAKGTLTLKVGKASLQKFSNQGFPLEGSLIPDENVSNEVIQTALTDVCDAYPTNVNDAARALIKRRPPAGLPQFDHEAVLDAALRITQKMDGDCLVIQGPPGTGKTYTAARVINALLQQGKNIGIVSNGHKAIMNLIHECGKSQSLRGCKAGGDENDPIYQAHPGFTYVDGNSNAKNAFRGGLVGGTAWLFARDEWIDQLDYLFIDEAGQVSLANAIAMSRCTKNIVLMGDQMQLEQPIQGAHPGYASMSVLQYCLLDTDRSVPDGPVYHAVVPKELGLFLGVTRRMHSKICGLVSDLMYEGRLTADASCDVQRIDVHTGSGRRVNVMHGIVFSGVEHDGNIQSSTEEVQRVIEIYQELIGQSYTSKDGTQRPLTTDDFLFIAPYNAQVRALQNALGSAARVGSVDKFQGQEAPVCILSMCSSFGEYGSRGLHFILDQNRINVAISRAQCLAVVVGDPRICSTPVSSVNDMKLVNGYCRIVDEV